MSQTTPPLSIVTGPSGSGKTTHCTAVANAARQEGQPVSGLLSPAIFDGDEKVAIDLVSIATGERRRMAQRDRPKKPSVPIGWWYMDPDVLRWANEQLSAVEPHHILILDELGPLEFEAGAGFREGLRLLDAGAYAAAVVVIRPSLVTVACERWPVTDVLDLAKTPA